MEGLEFVRDMTWPEVLETWRKAEEGIWEPLFRERGFSTWEEWRMSYFDKANIDPTTFAWKQYRIERPEEMVPQFFVGPFKGWQQYLPEGKPRARFAELNDGIASNEKVRAVLNDFPHETTMLGLVDGQGEVTLFDGSHRAAALTIAHAAGHRIAHDVFVMLAHRQLNA